MIQKLLLVLIATHSLVSGSIVTCYTMIVVLTVSIHIFCYYYMYSCFEIYAFMLHLVK